MITSVVDDDKVENQRFPNSSRTLVLELSFEKKKNLYAQFEPMTPPCESEYTSYAKGQKRRWITYSASAATWSTSRQLSETTSYCHTAVTIEWSLPALGTFRLEEFRPHYALSPGGKDIGRSLQKNRSPQTYWLWKRQWSSGHGTRKDTGILGGLQASYT